MPNDPNAALAVSRYQTMRHQENWAAADVWKSIARLLLTCEIWEAGWQPFHDVVVFRERNDFKISPSRGANATMRAADQLTRYLAAELNVPRTEVCNAIGLYFKQPTVWHLQPNNLLGNAFRSLVVEILRDYGSPGISYSEEVDPSLEFPGHTLRLGARSPALISLRGREMKPWRFFSHAGATVITESYLWMRRSLTSLRRSGLFLPAVYSPLSASLILRGCSRCGS